MRKIYRHILTALLTAGMLAASLSAGRISVSADNVQDTFSRSSITITAESAGKTFDGTPLTASGYSITAGQLASGDELVSADVAGSQTDAGLGDNVVSGAVIMNGDENVTDQYSISYSNGALMVEQASLTIRAASAGRNYDGEVLSDPDYSIVSGSFAGSDGFSSVTVEGSRTDVGKAENQITSYEFTNGTNPGNYDIKTEGGILTVAPAGLIVAAVSDSAAYSGKALTNGNYTAIGLVSGDTLTASVSGFQTEAGSSANRVVSCSVSRGGRDVTGNYSISFVNGTLTVNPAPVPENSQDVNSDSSDGEDQDTDEEAADSSSAGSSSSKSSGNSSGTSGNSSGTAGSSSGSTSSNGSAAGTGPDSTASDTSSVGSTSANGTSSNSASSAGTVSNGTVPAAGMSGPDSSSSEGGYTLKPVEGDADESVPLASGKEDASSVNTGLIVWILIAAGLAGGLIYYMGIRKRRKEMQNLCSEISYDDMEMKDKKD